MHHRHPGTNIATLNFELWVEIFCVPTCFHMRILKSCLSVPRQRKLSSLRQYQSYISNWYIDRKVFTSTTRWTPLPSPKKKLNTYLSVSAVVFCKQFLAYIDSAHWLVLHAFYKHSNKSQHISVLTTCTFMFRQVCIIEPSYFMTTSGMHSRPFEGRHLIKKIPLACPYGALNGSCRLDICKLINFAPE